MSEQRIIRLVDRSRVVEDWRCPRARYWHYEYRGKGISPRTTSLELHMGTVIHDALGRVALREVGREDASHDQIALDAAAAMRDTLSAVADGEVLSEDQRVYAEEQAALVEGLIRGFIRHAWPRLLRPGWTIVAVEQETRVTLSAAIHFMSKPDLILEDPDGGWWYVEYKSTSSKRQGWVDSWNTAVQLHSAIKAVEETLGQAPVGVIVQGLYKGYEAYGRQQSPFCYVYRRIGTPPFTNDAIDYTYRAGYQRVPSWLLSGGVRDLVATMPELVLADQLPQAPPIFVKDALVERFFAQTRMREEAIADAMHLDATVDPSVSREALLDKTFPQKFDQCQPAFGRACAFRRLCHSHVEDPLTQGFDWRAPHHQPEVDAQGGHE